MVGGGGSCSRQPSSSQWWSGLSDLRPLSLQLPGLWADEDAGLTLPVTWIPSHTGTFTYWTGRKTTPVSWMPKEM